MGTQAMQFSPNGFVHIISHRPASASSLRRRGGVRVNEPMARQPRPCVLRSRIGRAVP